MTVVQGEQERYGERYFGVGEEAVALDREERARLEALGEVFDGVSRGHLTRAGVGPGWRCLEIGPGAGTVAHWLAETVGPDGSVVAVDRDTRHVAHRPHPRLTVREADLTADGPWPDGLEPGTFDLVHARMTVMHLRDRTAFLRRMAERLRPGGVLVVSDTAEIGGCASAHPDYRAAFTAINRFMADSIGSDTVWGRHYPAALAGCGLSGITLAVDAPVVEPGGPLARFWDMTFRQVNPRMIDGGYLTAAEAEGALRYLADPATRELSFVLCTATGRREG